MKIYIHYINNSLVANVKHDIDNLLGHNVKGKLFKNMFLGKSKVYLMDTVL